MYRVLLALQCKYGRSDEGENGDMKEGRSGDHLTSCLYLDDLFMCGESEEALRMMMGRFVEVYMRRRQSMKIRAR